MKNSKLLLVLLVLIFACRDKKMAVVQVHSVAAVSQEVKWISLMSPEAWRGYNLNMLPGNWAIKNDIIE